MDQFTGGGSSIKNTGQTPARIVRMYTALTNSAVEKDGYVKCRIPQTESGEVNNVIGAGTILKLNATPIHVSDVAKIKKSAGRLFVFSHVEYEHIFSKTGESEITQFCFEVSIHSDLTYIQPGIEDRKLQTLANFNAYARFIIELYDPADIGKS